MFTRKLLIHHDQHMEPLNCICWIYGSYHRFVSGRLMIGFIVDYPCCFWRCGRVVCWLLIEGFPVVMLTLILFLFLCYLRLLIRLPGYFYNYFY